MMPSHASGKFVTIIIDYEWEIQIILGRSKRDCDSPKGVFAEEELG